MKPDLVHRTPFFYGWVILGAGTLGLVLTSPGQTYAMAVFLEHLLRDLDLSRSTVSALYTAGTLLGGFGLPYVGRMVDRYGCRPSGTVIGVLFGLACFGMAAVQGPLSLLLGFTGIRLLGQGSLGLVSNNVMNQWWVRRRGVVMGVSGMAMSLLGVGLFPPLLNRLIAEVGWRAAYAVLGAGLLAVLPGAAFLLFRERLERYGLLPDGGLREEEALPAHEDWTWEEAVRTPAFWLIGSGLSALALLITGLHFHAVSLFEAGGLTRTLAADMFLPLAVTTSVVTVTGGVLRDRLPMRVLLAAALALQTAGLLLARELTTVPQALVYSVVLGATAGLFHLMFGVVWADYFGRRHLGAIAGTGTTLVIAGSAAGPLPLALAHEALGSYDLALQVLALLPIGLAVATLFLKTPRRG